VALSDHQDEQPDQKTEEKTKDKKNQGESLIKWRLVLWDKAERLRIKDERKGQRKRDPQIAPINADS